jgi:hypothetical protein
VSSCLRVVSSGIKKILSILQILQSCLKSALIVRRCTRIGHDFMIFMIDMLMYGYNTFLSILQILQSCQKSALIVRHCTRSGQKSGQIVRHLVPGGEFSR